MLQSFTKILFSLVWWQVWNIDSYHILTKQKVHCGGICLTIIDNTVLSKNIGPVFGMPLHWKPIVVIVITQVVIMMTTCRDHSDDQVGITTIFDFKYYSWSSEHRITIAKHCHSQRFLESESLSYYRVLNMLVRLQTVRDTRRITLNNESISYDKWVTSLWIVC